MPTDTIYTSDGKKHIIEGTRGTITISPVVDKEEEEVFNAKKRPNTSVFNAKEDWNLRCNLGLTTGASIIGKSAEKLYAFGTTDGFLEVNFNQNNEKSGTFFNTKLGLRYDTAAEITPNGNRGGGYLSLDAGYQLPVYKNRNCTITYVPSVNFEGAYCSNGKDNRVIDIQDVTNETYRWKCSQYVQWCNKNMDNSSNNNSCSNKHHTLESVTCDKVSFDGKTTDKANMLYGEKCPNLDTYYLKAGIGNGLSFNVDTNGDGEKNLSVYTGIDIGYHKFGPEYTMKDVISCEGKTKTYEYHQPGYKHDWYVTPKIGVNYSMKINNANTLNLFVKSDVLHSTAFGFSANIMSRDLEISHKRRKK